MTEYGSWYCTECGDEKVLSMQTVVARCCGSWEVTYQGQHRGTGHWPTEMAFKGTVPAESPSERLGGLGWGEDLSPTGSEAYSGADGVGDALGSPTHGPDEDDDRFCHRMGEVCQELCPDCRPDLRAATERAEERWGEAIARAGQTFGQPHVPERLMTPEERAELGVRAYDYLTTSGNQVTRREGLGDD